MKFLILKKKEVLSLEANVQDKKYDYLPLGIAGLGGWLILIQIGLYFTIFTLLVQLFQYNIPAFSEDTWEIFTSIESEFYHPLWGPVIIFEALYNISFLVFCIYILFAFYGKKAVLPRLMIVFYSLSFFVGVVDLILLYQIPIIRETEDGSSIRDIIKSAITCAIWIPYFIKSNRVKNTFLK